MKDENTVCNGLLHIENLTYILKYEKANLSSYVGR